MKNRKVDIAIFIILAALAVHIIVVYPLLPETIPTHWNFKGEIDGWGGKSSLWLLYGITVLTNFFMLLVPKIEPKKENYEKFKDIYPIFRFMLVMVFAGLLEVNIKAGFDPNGVEMHRLVPIMLCILIIVLGNYLPKCKHNYTIGVRTPWTLASETVWTKTHRLSGVLWVASGIVMLIANLLINGTFSFIITMVGFVIISLIPTIYSYIEFNKEKNIK